MDEFSDFPKKKIIEINNRYKIPVDYSLLNTCISPHDDMYVPGLEEHYFKVGLSGIRCILNSISASMIQTGKIKKILDFPCGWGRVLRFLKSSFPNTEIYGGDINQAAIDFCKKNFRIKTVDSNEKIREIDFNQNFDLIWCGSFFTHLNQKQFKELFRTFSESLNQDGILVFTTFGAKIQKQMEDGSFTCLDAELNSSHYTQLIKEYYEKDYGHIKYPDNDNYGISLVKPNWIFNLIKNYDSLELSYFKEKLWDDNLDVFCVMEKK